MGFWDWAQGVAAKAPITNWFVEDPSVQRQQDQTAAMGQAYQDQRAPTAQAYSDLQKGVAGQYSGYGQTMAQAYDPAAASSFGYGQAGGGSLTRGVEGMSQLSPGAGEQYFNNQQHRYGQGGEGADYWAQTQQDYQQGPAEQYWNSVSGGASTQLASEGAFRGAQSLQGPSMLGQYAQQNLGQFTQPTEAEWALQHGRQALSGPSMSQQYVAQNLGQFNQPTFAQQYLGQISGQLQDQPRNSQQAYDEFMATTPGSMDPYYERAMTKAAAGINQGLAASGMLASSAGANQVTDAIAGIAVQQARDEAQYGLQRAQTAGSLAQGADTGAQNYWRTGADLAMGADRARLDQLLGGVTASGQASADEYARAMGLGELSGSADERALAALLGGAGVAGQASADQLSRTALYGDMAQGLDASMLARTLGYGGLAQGADASMLGRTTAGQEAALGVDAMDLDKLYRGQQSAMGAQGMRDERIQAQLDNEFRVAQQMAMMQAGLGQAAIGADQELMDAYWAAMMGQAQQDVNANDYTYLGKAAKDFGYAGDIVTMGRDMQAMGTGVTKSKKEDD